MNQKENWQNTFAQIQEIKVGMLTTVLAGGVPKSRPMMNIHNGFRDGFLYFFSDDDTEKASEIVKNPNVVVNYSCPKRKFQASIRGRASIIKDRNQFEKFWSPMVSIWYPKGMDDDKLCLIAIKTEYIEYWDSERNPFVKAFEIAASGLEGKRPNLTDNKSINLK